MKTIESRSDPVIDEVREVRRHISARFNHDPTRLVEYYTKLQEQYRHRLIGNVSNKEVHDPSHVPTAPRPTAG